MRRRLVLLAASTTSMVVLAFLLPLVFLVRTLADDRAIRPAELAAQGLAPVVTLGDRATVAAAVEAARARLGIDLAVVEPGGAVVGGLATPPPPEVPDGTVRADLPDGSARVIVPVVRTDATAMVVADVAASVRRRGVATATWTLGLLGVGLVVGAVVVADLLARRTIRSIADLEATAQRLSAGDLDARATGDGPVELDRVGAALGTLADRIDVLVAREREQAADLSHRLRTPLTALRLDVDALPDAGHRHRLQGSLDRLQATVNRVIADARRPSRRGSGEHVDLVAVVRERVAFWGALADDEGRTIGLATTVPAADVALDAGSVAEVVDVLLGNVFAHTPEGVDATVSIAAEPDGWRLDVADEGPGWPVGVEVARRGVSGGGGSGLGLDIVARTAEAAGGRVALGTTTGGGAAVTVHLPAAGSGSATA